MSDLLEVRIRLEDGPPAPRILEVVAEEAADLLVVGTHGRTGLERVMVGSVADRLLRQATCPVLTVRSASGSGPAPERQSAGSAMPRRRGRRSGPA